MCADIISGRTTQILVQQIPFLVQQTVSFIINTIIYCCSVIVVANTDLETFNNKNWNFNISKKDTVHKKKKKTAMLKKLTQKSL